mmetsp:Transcript_33035/g.97465  ORF Transcript_33035/g.97465 Transcript_33035/m.97465 type:complete len:307 (-) Transcript_33035:773-1693(-)
MCSHRAFRDLPFIAALLIILPNAAKSRPHLLTPAAHVAVRSDTLAAFSSCSSTIRRRQHVPKYTDTSLRHCTALSASRNFNTRESNTNSPTSAAEMRRLEAEVEASAMARLDKERVKRALQNKRDGIGGSYAYGDPSTLTEYEADQPPSRMKIAFAAGTSAATVALLALHTPLPIGACAFAVVAAYAAVDPLDDGGGIFAPLARILGRATIETTNTAMPRVKGAILAATTGEEEISRLKRRVQELEKENVELKQYLGIRETVDDNMNAFTLDELRDYARRNGVVFSGRSKAQLFATLLERGIIQIN